MTPPRISTTHRMGGSPCSAAKQSLPPCVTQVVQLLQHFVVAHLLVAHLRGTLGGFESQDGTPQLVEGVPRLGAGAALGHKRPLLLYHHPLVGADELLDVAALGLGQSVGVPED